MKLHILAQSKGPRFQFLIRFPCLSQHRLRRKGSIDPDQPIVDRKADLMIFNRFVEGRVELFGYAGEGNTQCIGWMGGVSCTVTGATQLCVNQTVEAVPMIDLRTWRRLIILSVQGHKFSEIFGTIIS